jgi:hypothetical protein
MEYTIKNVQPRDTSNDRHSRHRTNTNKATHATQKNKRINHLTSVSIQVINL